jgi:hypothetical protein
MKANIISSLGFKLTENFKKEVQKRIPDGIQEVWLFNFEIKWKGYGQYSYRLLIQLDDIHEVFKWETNDSRSYDFWKGAERNREIDNFEKRRILSLLEQYQDEMHAIVNNK